MESPMSPFDDFKVAMCLSPQDKLKTGGLLAQRTVSSKKADTALLDAAASDVDSGWISDDNLRAMDFDDRLNHDIDWVVVQDSSLSLAMDLDRERDDDVVNDFGFGTAASYLSPLRSELLLPLEDLSSEVSSSFDCGVSLAPLEPRTSGPDAEKLLMSFDTMNFTIPSPTSSSSKKKRRASLFGKGDAPATKVARTAVPGCMSPSLKLKVTARALSPEELLDAAMLDASKPSLAPAAPAAAAPASSVFNVLSLAPGAASLPATAAAAAAAAAATAATLAAAPLGAAAAPGGESLKKIGSYSPEARKLRIQKFHEKRKSRTWKKSIKYDCRKKLADDRPRIKGRFVRVLDEPASSSGSGASSVPKDTDAPLSPLGAMSPASISFTPAVTPLASPVGSPVAMEPGFLVDVAAAAAAAQDAAAAVVEVVGDDAGAADALLLHAGLVAVDGDASCLRRVHAAGVEC